MGMQGQMMQMGGLGDGEFSCQTIMMSSHTDENGQVHSERFCSSSVGDRNRSIAETQQAYTNSSSGIDKMSLERQMGDRGRKMVKERNRFSGEERNTDLYRGMTEDHTSEFDASWQQNAVPCLPRHIDTRAALMGVQSQPVSMSQVPHYATRT